MISVINKYDYGDKKDKKGVEPSRLPSGR